MLEGLEINIINFADTYSNLDNTLRIDSEHYLRKYKNILHKISSKKHARLSDLISTPVITGHTPSMKVDKYYGGNVKFIKTDNLRVNKISGDFSDTLTQEGDNTISRSRLKEGDIVTTIIGATHEIVGRTSIIQKEILPANINQNIALIRPNKDLINPNYLNIFLNTSYGRNLLYWQSRQTGQVNLNCREVERVYVPLFPDLETRINELVGLIEKGKILIQEAHNKSEKLLLDTLGLQNFQPSKEAVNIKSFSESFIHSGRLDAEYYQVKYDELENSIKQYSSFEVIRNIRTDNFRGLQPEYVENGALSVINSKHILENTLDYENFEKTDSAKWESQERARVFQGDILTYTTGANIGRTQVYLNEDKAIASNHVNILRLKKQYNPYYVGFVMNSLVGRMQTEKLSAGSAQAELYPKDIDQFLIPFCPTATQHEIVALVQQAYELKRQSEYLLKVAKTTIEIAIEQDEETALAYIEKQSNL